MSTIKERIKELENNTDFVQVAGIVTDIMRQNGNVIPTPRELYDNPRIDMAKLEKSTGISDRDNTLWELLIIEAKRFLLNSNIRNRLVKPKEPEKPLLREKHAEIIFRIEKQLRRR